jgi:hypothetical protein
MTRRAILVETVSDYFRRDDTLLETETILNKTQYATDPRAARRAKKSLAAIATPDDPHRDRPWAGRYGVGWRNAGTAGSYANTKCRAGPAGVHPIVIRLALPPDAVVLMEVETSSSSLSSR